jgi:hopanoid biosynthesis associated protein HpnK
MKRVVITADDFGLSEAVNEGIEQAHRDGILTSASLMMGGPAVEDAVRRARRLPRLRVGLHLVVIEGPTVLPRRRIPDLVDDAGWFPSDQSALGVRYFFRLGIRRQLAAEIRAQFGAFAATGLALDHADAHKHMHLHPTVGAMMLAIGREFRLRAVRVPREPMGVMAACGVAPSAGARAMAAWSGVFRRQARRAGMLVNDSVFGLAWSGAMTEARLLQLLPLLPAGLSEIYFHPAAGRDALLDRLMPTYRHADELAALLSPAVRQAAAGVRLAGYADFGAG